LSRRYTRPTGWGIFRLPHARRLDADIDRALEEIRSESPPEEYGPAGRVQWYVDRGEPVEHAQALLTRFTELAYELDETARGVTPDEEADMERVQAWGRVRKTKSAAIEDAAAALARLASELRRTVVGYPRYDEVRPTPTGYQARVSVRMRPKGES